MISSTSADKVAGNVDKSNESIRTLASTPLIRILPAAATNTPLLINTGKRTASPTLAVIIAFPVAPI